MAMSDLELLQLVEQAKERQRGPQGPAGVGIEGVEQYDGQSFTLRLTDGSFKRIDLQPGQDGSPGEPGPAGAKGEPGPAGRDGRPGSAGDAGAPGLPGSDGTSVDSALVDTRGHLLLGLTDGSIVDCGAVIGPAGPSGPSGGVGLPGRDGVNGTAVLSGPRAPQESDGQEGDHWIDISSAEFGFYKKGGNGWDKLANLRQPAPDRVVGIGAGSAGGGGGGGHQLQNTRTLPLVNPSIPDGLETQEDYNVFVYDALSNLGQGEGGIETFPWIRIYMFKSEPSTNWFYQTSWETNTNADYTWQWEVDANNTDDFIDIADHPQKTELGFDGREYSNGLFLNKIGQESTFPNAKIRQRITSQINTSPVNELSTPVMQMWEIFEDVIDEPLYSKGESGGGGSGNPFATNDRVDVVQQEVDDLSAAQGTTQSEVDTLQNKVTALEGTVIDGRWKLDNRTTARAGYYVAFAGINNATTWDSVTSIQMNPQDEDGKTFTFAQIAIGDVIRIGASGSSAIFKCTSTFTQSGDVYNATVELLNSSGTPAEALSYNFEFLPSFDPSAFATVDYVDQQDAKDLKFDAPNDVTTGFRIKSDNKTLISTATAGELGLYHVKDPTDGNDEWAATKGYVDSEINKIEIPSIEWAPSNFAWEWGGYNDTREDPGRGKFQLNSDNKTKICFSAYMANGIYVGNTFKSSSTYSGHKDRLCLWRKASNNQWKVFFDGLIVKWDSASDWWHMELDPNSYGRITSFTSGTGLFYAVGGPFA